ncbi:GntR family transcriptional regulator [Pseudomonas aeruginosa]|nr:GntR family transcriptional regulator [Pseudomonas aeruginosa]
MIYQSLREQIERGLLARGSKPPSERQLSELFSTTRITLREALGQLEDQGLIYREERRGWFVSPQRLRRTTRWCAATSTRWSPTRAGCRRPRCSARR